jgi:hypothetical protein
VTLYRDEIVPWPGALTCTTVYRRLLPGRKLVGHVVTRVYDENHERQYTGTSESSEVGKVSGVTWECPCGAQSRNIWARANWARKALLGHWQRTHSPSTVARCGAS